MDDKIHIKSPGPEFLGHDNHLKKKKKQEEENIITI